MEIIGYENQILKKYKLNKFGFNFKCF